MCFYKKIDINSSVVTHYVRENNNQSEVFWKCSFPYIRRDFSMGKKIEKEKNEIVEKLGYTNLLELEEKWKHKYQR